MLRRAVDALVDGTFCPPDEGLQELHDSLLKGASWHQPDHYFLFADFDRYLQAKLKVNRDYRNSRAFAAKCLRNIAGSGIFSSDRTMREYANDIWHI